MPRPAKGARLYLRAARPERRMGGPCYVIRDGDREISTGCGPDRLADAERELEVYLAGKRQAPPAVRDGDPASVAIADVLIHYAEHRVPQLADPASNLIWIEHLIAFWGALTCDKIVRSRCEAYVRHRTAQPKARVKSPQAVAKRVSTETARRELEVLSAAIGYWHGEWPFARRPTVSLPPKAESPRDALTREQGARLLKAAMGWQVQPDGQWRRRPGVAASRTHLRRFLLLGFYTGSRPGVLLKLLWRESPTQAWVDLDGGIIYRRGREERDHRTKRRPLCKIPPRLLAHMRRWAEADARAEASARAWGDDLTLTAVLHYRGRPFSGRIRTAWEGMVRDSGLSSEVTPHWMRHTAATWLMERDVEPWAAAGFMGMTPTVLETTYGHHRPSHQSAVTRAHSRR